MSRHDEAWEWLMKANQIMSEAYPIDRDEQIAKHHANQEQARNLRIEEEAVSPGPDCPTPIFILGISRSGKTLTEQILSSTSDVCAGYENSFIETAAKRACMQAGLLAMGRISLLPKELTASFATHYKLLTNKTISNVNFFTTTTPGLISEAGLIYNLLPHAKFIFVKRNIEDTAFRIFCKQYKDGTNRYSYDIKNAITDIIYYHKMISIWSNKFEKKRCITINYEDLILNTNELAEILRQFCGIENGAISAPEISDDSSCSSPYALYLRKHMADMDCIESVT
jgi:hypothetical protein